MCNAQVLTKAPRDCSAGEIGDLVSLVIAGGEVSSAGLERRVRSAAQLAFLRKGECLIGVAALKRPASSYRNRVSSSSGVLLPKTVFPYELGWVFILPSARGGKCSRPLSQAALASTGSEGVFSTSRTDNTSMHNTLGKLGFIGVGHAYPSRDGKHQLQLFVRVPPNYVLKPAAGETLRSSEPPGPAAA